MFFVVLKMNTIEKVTIKKILETQPYKTSAKCKQKKTEPLIVACFKNVKSLKSHAPQG